MSAAADSSSALAIGAAVPGFELPDTDGRLWRLPEAGEAAATLVVWTCNHCPYALAWHQRLLDVGIDYADRGLHVLMVNSNDGQRYTDDSPERMRERHRDEGWGFPYLHDADQSVARAWGARTTPDAFLLDGDRRLVYRGAPDADHQNSDLEARWVRAALDATLAGLAAEPARTDPVGCSIKWLP